jgi:hypothetical protein
MKNVDQFACYYVCCVKGERGTIITIVVMLNLSHHSQDHAGELI